MNESPVTKIATLGIFVILNCCALSSVLLAASPNTTLLKAKQDAETKGYIFLTNHDQIVAEAKREGKLRVLGSLSSTTYKAMITAFKKQYPSIDVDVEELTGTDAPQRFLLELKAGRVTDWDVFPMVADFWTDYIPYLKRFDILGMATQKVLAIPSAMIDPKNRNIMSIGSAIFVIGYNKKLIAEDKVPNTWEEFLKPEFKGKQFMVDLRPQGFAALAAGLGEQWAMDYASKIAAQEPVWVRGQSRTVAAMAAGEHPMLHLAYYHSCLRPAKKDPNTPVACKIIEPVPVRLHEFAALPITAPHPHASLLWLEFQVTPEGQSIINNYEPMNLSIYASQSELARVIQGKKLSVNKWDTIHNTPRWEQMTLKAFGFPNAEVK
jgi:iron(III) transport system substrate-binding protein